MDKKKTVKVRCLNNGEIMTGHITAQDASGWLTVGEIYEVIEHNPDQYHLSGGKIPYKVRFEVVDDKKNYTTSF